MIRPALLILSLVLAACQGNNPYTASALPLPPAPAHSADGVDSSAYPAAPRDYGRYRSWAWRPGQRPPGTVEASPEQVQEAVAAGLDQIGLRPARGSQADVLVSADLRVERRVQRVYDDYGHSGGYGYSGFRDFGAYPYGYHGRHSSGYGIGASVPLIRTYQVEVLVLNIQLLDARDGQPVWQGNAVAATDNNRGQRADSLHDAVREALAGYPP